MSNNSFNIGNNWNKDDSVKKETRGLRCCRFWRSTRGY